jgi:hypothetical protein
VGRNEKKDQQVQAVKKDILLDMPAPPIPTTAADTDEDGHEMLGETAGEGIGHLMDGVAPGYGMLFEMLKMAMESDAGAGVPQKSQLHRQQTTAITCGYEEHEESGQEEK